jgi:hypothetical protein
LICRLGTAHFHRENGRADTEDFPKLPADQHSLGRTPRRSVGGR